MAFEDKAAEVIAAIEKETGMQFGIARAKAAADIVASYFESLAGWVKAEAEKAKEAI